MIALLPEYSLIDLEDINIDYSYQRQPSAMLVSRIAAHFDETACGHILVNVRDNNDVYLVDGQHRFLAMRKLGMTKAKCQVSYGLTVAREAEEFKLRNSNIKGTSALERFHASLVIGTPEAVKLNTLLQSLGLHVPRYIGSRDPKAMHCIAVLETIYKRHGDVFVKDMLELILATWPNQQQALHQRLVGGMAWFLERYKDKYDRKRFIKALGVHDPSLITTSARTIENLSSGKSAISYIGQLLVDRYNTRLSEDRRLN